MGLIWLFIHVKYAEQNFIQKHRENIAATNVTVKDITNNGRDIMSPT